MSVKNNNYTVIVSGGLGTRLWPLSHAGYPKQFIPLFDGQSLFQKMVENASATVSLKNVFIVCPLDYSIFIKRQTPKLPKQNIIIEPERKDNFAAIVLAMSVIYAKNPKANVAILWSDHYIFKPKSFISSLIFSFSLLTEQSKSLVVVGTKPDYPETGFGYIKKGKLINAGGPYTRGAFAVSDFKEKPDDKTAERYYLSEKYLWNTGYKIVKAEVFLSQIKTLYPRLKKTLAGLHQYSVSGGSRLTLKKLYKALPAGSIEFLYTNKIKEVVVVESKLKWSDVGNWQALTSLLEIGDKSSCLRSSSSSVLIDSNNVSVYGNNKLVAAVGVKDMIIVETKQGFLIVHKDSVHKVKDLYTKIQKQYPRLA